MGLEGQAASTCSRAVALMFFQRGPQGGRGGRRVVGGCLCWARIVPMSDSHEGVPLPSSRKEGSAFLGHGCSSVNDQAAVASGTLCILRTRDSRFVWLWEV